MAGIDGTWNTVTKTPMGDQEAALTLRQDGDTVTGTSVGTLGSLELENGKVSGNTVTWTMNMTIPMPMTLEATVTIDGDTLTGGIAAGAFGTMPINGTRA